MDIHGTWVAAHLSALRAIAFRAAALYNRLLDVAAIEDLAQETALRLQRYRGKPDPKDRSWEALAMEIAKNLAVDWRRRKRAVSFDAFADFDPASPEPAEPDEDAIHDGSSLREALAGLPADSRARLAGWDPELFPPDGVARKAFEFRFGLSWEDFLRLGLTPGDLAARLGRTVNSVFDKPRERVRKFLAARVPQLAKYMRKPRHVGAATP